MPQYTTIKQMKDKMNAARFAGENASNIVEISNIISFIKTMKLVHFGVAEKPIDTTTFEDHPDIDRVEDKASLSQLWSTFGRFSISLNMPDKQKLIDGTFTISMIGIALYHYIARIKNISKRQVHFTPDQQSYPIRYSSRINLQHVTYHSQLHKYKQKNITKDGYYVMFKYAHTIYRNGLIVFAVYEMTVSGSIADTDVLWSNNTQ
ncbi:hypothetical protein BDF20DRAFT_985902 [Mycotypha africana]|uniref:uncharacterized protein n=1 Tax=Mycotypha africana TaxID=64632 RepID=UPI002301B075|nr:uncharacterized protein BDF20DRAFT_985902 [Mycotypha africana]KAI8983916.1 hypothetical protein BDF20DRAFT_985902 [Mycotypha africana]